jgi:very-short-patch-repair endonuclease
MGQKMAHSSSSRLWTLARNQHGVIARRQLLALGFNSDAVTHRLAKGRLHRVATGVYAVGRPELTRYGRWMAAVLSCGPGAALSHQSAAALFQIRDAEGRIEVSVPARSTPRRRGIRIHRRIALTDLVTLHHGITVTNPACTLVDIAPGLPDHQLEAAINQADALGLIRPETLRLALDELPCRPGVALVRRLLDRWTFMLTDSELERRFLVIVRSAGLGRPRTQVRLRGFRVDFYWPDLGLIVETDGLRYHRTAASQARDRRRDQVLTAAGFTILRFTHAQVAFEPDYVRSTLAAVAERLAG